MLDVEMDAELEAQAAMIGTPRTLQIVSTASQWSTAAPLWKKLAAGASASLLLCAAIAGLAHAGMPSQAPDAALFTGPGVPEQKTMVVAEDGRDHCASWKENCYSKGCCRQTGYSCFETTGQFKAKCMKSCDPQTGKKCTMAQAIMAPRLQEVTSKPAMSLYCFSVVTVDTGSPKPSHELDLIKYQYAHGLSIFDCEQTGLFSDKPLQLDEGVNFTQVFDVEHDWHFAKRKSTGAWVNTGLFTQVWKAVQTEAHWVSADWIVKVDPDAVFVPKRLVKKLEFQYEIADGLYMENCQYVDYGFFGNLEVISKKAFTTLLAHIDECKAEINWKVGIKNGKYGPMGEDLFAQMCMSKHGVKRFQAFDISMDGACEAKRDEGHKKDKKWQPHCGATYASSYHPFKKPEQWATCMQQAIAAFPQPM